MSDNTSANGTRVSRSLLARNVALNYGVLVLPLGAMLATTPYIVNGLGPERYGVLAIVGMLLGYFSLSDLGVGRASTAMIAESLGAGRPHEARPIIRAALRLLSLLGLAAAAILVMSTRPLLGGLFNLEGARLDDGLLAMQFAAAGLFLNMVRAPLSGSLEAHQRFDITNALKVASSVLSSVLPVVAVAWGYGVAGVVALWVIKDALLLSVTWLIVWRITVPGRNWRPGRQENLNLLSAGAWMTLTMLATMSLRYVDFTVIGATLPIAALTLYAVPYDLLMRLGALGPPIADVLFPAYGTVKQGSVTGELEALFWRSFKYLLVVVGTPLLLFAAFSRQILTWWIGPELAPAGLTLTLLALAALPGLFSFHLTVYLQGTGHASSVGILSLVRLGARAMLAVLMVPTFGIVGAATSCLITEWAAAAGFYRTAVRRRLLQRVRGPARAGAPILAVVTATTLAYLASTATDSTVLVMISGGTLIMACVLTVWRSLFDEIDRDALRAMATSLLRRVGATAAAHGK